MTNWNWLFVPASLLAGALVSWILGSIRLARQTAASSALAARAGELDIQLKKAEVSLEEERNKNTALSVALAASQSDKSHLLERLESEALRIAEMQDRMKLEFENLASRLLEEKSTKFLDQNQQHLAALLTPFRERLGEFRERMELIHTEDEKSTAALGAQLKNLHDLNRQLAEEAGNLTSALKGQSKTQGSWGELVLERILEKCGLTKGVEYETQASFQDEEGGRRMPDVVIHLPEGKNLIIDAKVSLTAYEKSVNAGTESLRMSALREHVLSLRRHVEELSRKDYPGLKSLRTPDFVLMFIPVEPALHLALQEDPSLYGDAFEKNVVLVSSSTLLVALRAVESVWRHQKQTENALEIARQAGNLHDAFVLFTESLEDVGSRLDQAKQAFDLALSRLATGRGNLVKRTLELQKLGARTDKQLSPAIARLSEE
ncbi:MAG: DNA recombination protein RmuC [Terrimicrobiaceae bacterium]